MDPLHELEALANRPEIRTADRANIRRMVEQLRQGKQLSYQERQNAWAYIQRYRRLSRIP